MRGRRAGTEAGCGDAGAGRAGGLARIPRPTRRPGMGAAAVAARASRAAEADCGGGLGALPGPMCASTRGSSWTAFPCGGTTATGLPVGWGVVAVDPSVIPLGTHLTVPGYGEAVAADTGGAVVGNTIDLWFPSVAQANAWGRRLVTITLH